MPTIFASKFQANFVSRTLALPGCCWGDWRLRLIKTVMRHANLGWKVYLVLNVVLVESNIINTYCFSHDVVGDQKQNALRNQLTSSPEERKLVPARINDQNQFQYMTTHCWSVNRYLNLLLVMVVSLFLSKVSWWFDSTFLLYFCSETHFVSSWRV